MEIAFLIGWVAILFSSAFISFKIYKALKGRGNEYAVFLAIVCFVVSFILMAFALILIAVFSGQFGRR